MNFARTIRISALFITMACAAFTLASPCWAQEHAAAPHMPHNARFGNPDTIAMNYQNYFYGVITKITKDSLVLDKTKVGVPQTIQLSKKTKYVRDGKRSLLSKLQVGEMVYIDVKTNKKTGAMLARKVVSGLGATALP